MTLTVIGKEGNILLQNHIFKLQGVENNGTVNVPKDGVNPIVMAPVQPHTVSKKSRTCESCHTSLKAQGKGINGGKYFADQSKTTIVDLMRADKTLLVKGVDEQIPAIPNLKYDYSVMIDENGTQVQTVGNHWRLSQALDNEMHKNIVNKSILLSAWFQVLGAWCL